MGPENKLLRETLFGCLQHDSSQNLSPIVVVGPSACGKSHLLCHLFEFSSSSGTAILTDSTHFSAEFSEATKLREADQFVGRFVSCDYFLFDDLEHLHSKPKTQLMLASVLQRRSKLGLPSVLTAQKVPNAMPLLSRLQSWLSGGVVLPLHAPSPETLKIIVSDIADQSHIRINERAVDRLVKEGTNNLFQIKQLLFKVCANTKHATTSEIITEQLIIDLASDALTDKKIADPKVIIRETARFYGLKVSDLTAHSRRKQNTLARAVAMFLIRSQTKQSYQQIGKLFGNRDHSTVLHACRKIKSLQQSDPTSNNALQALKERISSKC